MGGLRARADKGSCSAVVAFARSSSTSAAAFALQAASLAAASSALNFPFFLIFESIFPRVSLTLRSLILWSAIAVFTRLAIASPQPGCISCLSMPLNAAQTRPKACTAGTRAHAKLASAASLMATRSPTVGCTPRRRVHGAGSELAIAAAAARSSSAAVGAALASNSASALPSGAPLAAPVEARGTARGAFSRSSFACVSIGKGQRRHAQSDFSAARSLTELTLLCRRPRWNVCTSAPVQDNLTTKGLAATHLSLRHGSDHPVQSARADMRLFIWAAGVRPRPTRQRHSSANCVQSGKSIFK